MWKIEMFHLAKKSLVKLDRPNQVKIAKFIDNISKLEEPHKKAKALTGKLVGLWRYRVGDYRIMCKIDGKLITILVLDIGHRKEVYR